MVKADIIASGQAMDFSRKVFRGRRSYHHIGLYGYRRQSLSYFWALPPSLREKEEKLEQLRALEAGMRIDVVHIDNVPMSVDTQDDLKKAREFTSV